MVSIFLKDMNIVTVNEDAQEIKISMAVEGYVINIDSDFFYLGLPDGSITKSIPHTSVGLVEIQFSGTMMDGDIPMRDEDIN